MQAQIVNFDQLLIEAVKRRQVKVTLTKETKKLSDALGRLFTKHGVAIQRKLKSYRSEFKESLIDDIDNLFNSTAPTDAMGTAIQDSIERIIELGAQALIKEFDADIVFNLENPRAVEYTKNYGATAIVGIDDTSLERLRTIITNAVEAGKSYDRLARDIRALFTDFSTTRAKLIATTELGNAYQEGNLIVARDLKASGLVMQKKWLARDDGKADQHCLDNMAQDWIDVDEEFKSSALRPLDHPRCRCVLLYRRKPDASDK